MHPLLFQYKYIAVYSFGAMLAVAFLAGISLVHFRAKKANFPPQQVVDFCLWMLIASIIGARAFYVAQNWNYYQFHFLEMLMVQKGGLVFYGGMIFGLLFSFLYFKLKKWPFWSVADILAPALALGHAFGRIGCFLNGCCFGDLTNVPWGVQFPDGSPAAIEFGPLHLVHPTQLYSAASLILLCLFLIYFDKKKKFQGQTFIVYLFLYSIIRFVIEIFRGDNPSFFLSLTLSQCISVLMLVLAIILYFILSVKSNKHVQSN